MRPYAIFPNVQYAILICQYAISVLTENSGFKHSVRTRHLNAIPRAVIGPDQLYLHSNVPALVAIFIRFRRRGARTAGGAAAGRPRRVRRNRMNIVTRAGTLEWRCPPCACCLLNWLKPRPSRPLTDACPVIKKKKKKKKKKTCRAHLGLNGCVSKPKP